MTILVTGAAGFIGSNLVDTLLAHGHTVVGVDNFDPYYPRSRKLKNIAAAKANKKFTLYEADIRDGVAMKKLLKDCEAVFHLAAKAGVRNSLSDPFGYNDVNVTGTLNLLELSRNTAVKKLVYASSSSVYGGNEKLPCSEEDRTDDPLSLYGQNKKDNELMAHAYHSLYGTPVTGLRFFTVYGPWGRPDMALFLFTDALLHNRSLQIFGEGKMQRDFTYVDDIADGIIASIDKNFPEEVFNLGCGRKEELMDYVKMVETSCSQEAKKDFLPMQPGDVKATLADIEKARTMLGYEPKTTIKEGVPKFVEWYREYYKI